MRARNRALIPLSLSCLLLALSCTGVNPVAVRADRETFQAIAPEYLAYVEADPALSAEQKARRRLTVSTWDRRITAAEAAVR